VSAGLASHVLPSSTGFTWRSGMKLPIYLMRSGPILSASTRLPRCVLLTLLNADLTSMNISPAGCASSKSRGWRFSQYDILQVFTTLRNTLPSHLRLYSNLTSLALAADRV